MAFRKKKTLTGLSLEPVVERPRSVRRLCRTRSAGWTPSSDPNLLVGIETAVRRRGVPTLRRARDHQHGRFHHPASR